jgi:uncharacterized membrane protein YhaH (DUF805 family)
MNSYIKAMKNYAVFSGRSSRSDYWLFTLFYLIFSAVCWVLDGVMGNYVALVFSLVHIIPGLAVQVRRLHDTDRTGWWALIMLIPVVGFIILLVFLCQKSDEGANRFGPNPHPYGGTSPALGSVPA